jgi:chromosome segregation ATPase
MSWDFLRLARDSKTAAAKSDNPTRDGKVGAERTDTPKAEVHLLKNFDARALGAAREMARAKLDEFEVSLQSLTELPEQFRQAMAPIENAVNSMSLMRNRLEVAEETLAGEQLATGKLSIDLTKALNELERTQFNLKNEQTLHASLVERSKGLEASIVELRQNFAEATAKVSRIEPQLRETIAARDAGDAELTQLRKEKVQLDDQIVSLRQELGEARDGQGSALSQLSEMTLNTQRTQERLEESQAQISQLEGALGSINSKLSNVATALQNERNIARTLRSDNEQLFRERDEAKLQFETQLEASRSRYQFIEKMLEESRARFQEETRQLSVARRERTQRDRAVGQLTLTIETLQRDLAELRSKVNSGDEALSTTSNMLNTEVESRRKLELELDVLRAENSNLILKQKSLTETARSNLAVISEATNKFQNKLAAMRSENEQLRSEINTLRIQQRRALDEEMADILLPAVEENIVPIR